MHRKDQIVVIACVFAFISVMSITFVESLPNMCANPSGSGNWVVQPLCK